MLLSEILKIIFGCCILITMAGAYISVLIIGFWMFLKGEFGLGIFCIVGWLMLTMGAAIPLLQHFGY